MIDAPVKDKEWSIAYIHKRMAGEPLKGVQTISEGGRSFLRLTVMLIRACVKLCFVESVFVVILLG